MAAQTLASPDISTIYKAQLSNALNNANSNTSLYQNKVQSALDNYSNAKKVDPQDSATFKNDMTNSINSLYNTQKDNVPLYYQTGIDQAKQQYAGLRNQASVANQQSLNRLNENMANQGLFKSGDNITAQTGINNQYANDLAGYNKQEQNYYDTTNNAIAQQKAGYDAQKAQAMIDLGYKADNRDFSLANLQDNRNQQQFSNSMTGIGSMYGMSQDQFNNTLKMIGQQYGMDQNQVQNLLNYAQFNSNENQRQFDNTIKLSDFNRQGIWHDQAFDYQKGRDTVGDNQWQQNYNMQDRNSQWENSRWAQQFVENNRQWQAEFDRQGTWHDQAQALAAARAASGGRSGGGRSSGGSGGGDYSNTDYKNSNQQSLHDYANNNSYSLAQKLQALSGYANSSGVDSKDAQYANEQKQALLDGRWYEGRYK